MNGKSENTDRTLDHWLTFIQNQHSKDIDMGLNRMMLMVERLGLQAVGHKVVTVAGTNGKGSTCVALEQLLLSHGLSVGTTLSPHVTRFNERIRLQGVELPDFDICEAFERVESKRNGLPLTYFEYSALVALLIFLQSNLDVAILEIGLGGRLDAFNVIDADIAVITSIGLDHQEFLGESLEEIGFEKAGILRPHQKVVLGQSMPDSVLKECAINNVELSRYGSEFGCANKTKDSWDYYSNGLNLECIPTGSLSAHNLSLAVEVARSLVSLRVNALIQTLPEVKLQGRMTRVQLDNLHYVFDVCHNPEGVEFFLEELSLRAIKPNHIVCGMFRNKDHIDFYQKVSTALNVEWILIDTTGRRGFSSNELDAAMGGKALCLESFDEARGYLKENSREGEVILALGSFNVLEQACASFRLTSIG